MAAAHNTGLGGVFAQHPAQSTALGRFSKYIHIFSLRTILSTMLGSPLWLRYGIVLFV